MPLTNLGVTDPEITKLWFRVRVFIEHIGRTTDVPWVDVRFVDHGPVETVRSPGISVIIERELQLGLRRELTRALQGGAPSAEQ